MATPSTPPEQPSTAALYDDFSKMLEPFSLSGAAMESALDARRKDIEALAEASRLACEGLQALMQKQAEIFSKTMQELQATVKQVNDCTDPAQALSRQGEFAQQALQNAFENMRELAEIAQKAQVEAMAVIGKRSEEDFREAGNLFKPH